MKKFLQISAFVLACSTSFMLAQMNNAPGQAGAPGQPTYQSQPGQPGQPGQPAPMPDGSSQPTSSNATSASTDQANQPQVDDQTLSRQVHDQLATNPDLSGVQISVDKGKVALTGSVPNKTDKKEAKKLAKSVPGVKAVREDLAIASNANAGNSSAVSNSSNTGSTTGVSGESPSSGSMSEQPPANSNPNNTPNAAPQTTPNSTTPPQSFMRSNFMGEQASSQAGSASTNPAASPNAAQQTPATEDNSASQSQVPPSTDAGSSAGIASPAGQAGSTDTSATAESSDQVKSDIQTAFRNEPTLTSSSVSVDVTADTITLSGTAPSQKDRDEAKRIAQSFAGNRKVVDNVKVSGMGTGSTTDMSNPNATPNSGVNESTTTNSNPSNPEQPNTPKK